MIKPEERKSPPVDQAAREAIEKHVDAAISRTLVGEVVRVKKTRSTWSRSDVDAVLATYRPHWDVAIPGAGPFMAVLTPPGAAEGPRFGIASDGEYTEDGKKW